ncbi:MAG: HAD-IC family P-type ATPase, partial [archaeon]
LEKNSEHPLAEAIVEKARQEKISFSVVKNFKALTGKGIQGSINSKEFFLSSINFAKQKLSFKEFENKISNLESEGKTVMALFSGKTLYGFIAVADTVKKESKEAVAKLSEMGIESWMITGDNENTAKAIAKQVGISNVFAEVLPDKKVEYVKKLQKQGKTVAMVGDGINDAPALAQADLGIAMSSGTDVAMEAGNLVLMKSNPLDVVRAIKLGRQTMNKIKQNMFWALFYNVVGIPVAAGILFLPFGILLSPMIAGGAMAFSSVSVVSNSLLLKRGKIE